MAKEKTDQQPEVKIKDDKVADVITKPEPEPEVKLVTKEVAVKSISEKVFVDQTDLLSKQSKQIEDMQKKFSTLQEDTSTFRNGLAAALGVKAETEPTIEDLLVQVKDSAKQDIQKLKDSTLKDMKQELQDLRQALLNTHKEKIIAENSGKLVTGLLTGKTKEELNASVDAAKAEFDRIAAMFQKDDDAQVVAQKKLTAVPGISTASSGAGGLDQGNELNVMATKLADRDVDYYKKNEDAIRKAIETQLEALQQ
jgi:hypothetical protein